MQIRRATSADLTSIIAMLADDDLGRQREDFHNPLPATYSEAFEAINADPNQELMVVEGDDGEVLGAMQLTFIQYLTYRGGLRAQIEAVRIRKDWRGQGLGVTMFKWAIERAREKGAHVLQLTTDKRRPDAIRFYESLGFNTTHEGMKLHFT